VETRQKAFKILWITTYENGLGLTTPSYVEKMTKIINKALE
jgi:hypothetical protein